MPCLLDLPDELLLPITEYLALKHIATSQKGKYWKSSDRETVHPYQLYQRRIAVARRFLRVAQEAFLVHYRHEEWLTIDPAHVKHWLSTCRSIDSTGAPPLIVTEARDFCARVRKLDFHVSIDSLSYIDGGARELGPSIKHYAGGREMLVALATIPNERDACELVSRVRVLVQDHAQRMERPSTLHTYALFREEQPAGEWRMGFSYLRFTVRLGA